MIESIFAAVQAAADKLGPIYGNPVLWVAVIYAALWPLAHWLTTRRRGDK